MLKYSNLSDEDALRLITLNPAKQLQIDQRVGSIDPGKDADLTIFDKHPLSNYAKVTKVLIDGEVYFDREQDLKNRGALAKEVQELMEKEKKAAPRGPVAAPPAPGTGLAPPSRRRPRQNETGEVLQ
jgi:adenine deaminase